VPCLSKSFRATAGTETLDPVANWLDFHFIWGFIKSIEKIHNQYSKMRPSARKQLLVILIVQCSWFLARIESGRVGHAMTEDEKQSAFEQLLGKASRLRMAGSSQTLFEATTIQPPTIATMSTAMPIMLSDEEAKRHDRRHAVHQPKKHNKKDHSKRQHHAGYYTFSSIWGERNFHFYRFFWVPTTVNETRRKKGKKKYLVKNRLRTSRDDPVCFRFVRGKRLFKGTLNTVLNPRWSMAPQLVKRNCYITQQGANTHH
jgi:hypothetical protein